MQICGRFGYNTRNHVIYLNTGNSDSSNTHAHMHAHAYMHNQMHIIII